VTNDDQYFLVKHQLAEFGIADENIIREPVARNTAPAIALGTKFIEEKIGDKNILVLPSDHIMADSFYDVAAKALNHSKKYLCTFGVVPNFPSTGYGYIKKGEKIDSSYLVESFHEKPKLSRAKEFLSKGGYLWNSGIFLFNIKKLKSEFKKHFPVVHKHLSTYSELKENYSDLPSISIDFAVLEKSRDLLVFPFKEGWRDVGSWESVYQILEKDESGNVKRGDVVSIDTENSLIYGGERLISTVGVKDLILVDTKDAILLANKSGAEDVRKIVDQLKKEGRSEVSIHATVYRPWGYYSVLESGLRYKVKRIAIYPGKSISLQLHHHRAEHWIVVKGTARIIKNEEEFFVHENESIYVPKSTHHRVENHGKVDLHIIEIQTGEYVEEDDIVRFEDEYGRV
jgi:mannose-1-phosphate guanylyltransferase/mannose-6-phosphate isomerase